VGIEQSKVWGVAVWHRPTTYFMRDMLGWVRGRGAKKMKGLLRDVFGAPGREAARRLVRAAERLRERTDVGNSANVEGEGKLLTVTTVSVCTVRWAV